MTVVMTKDVVKPMLVHAFFYGVFDVMQGAALQEADADLHPKTKRDEEMAADSDSIHEPRTQTYSKGQVLHVIANVLKSSSLNRLIAPPRHGALISAGRPVGNFSVWEKHKMREAVL